MEAAPERLSEGTLPMHSPVFRVIAVFIVLSQPVGVLAPMWELLAQVWGDNGCGIDPDGRCGAASEVAVNGDNGCGIDPSGGCR
jgi:hypothetical protein